MNAFKLKHCHTAIVVACLLIKPAPGDEVRLKEGRSISGSVSFSRTDDVVEVSSSHNGIRLTTRVLLSRIESIETGESPSEHSPPADQVRFASDGHVTQFRRLVPGRTPGHRSNRPASMTVATWPGNWDADPLPDGLFLRLELQDAGGKPVESAAGQLRVRLLGIYRPDRNSSRRPSAAPLQELDSWGTQLRNEQFEDGIAAIRLPFRRLAPESETTVAPWAAVEVSLGISSVGVIRSNRIDVPLQLPSSFRDDLYLSTGRRTLPSENTNGVPARRPRVFEIQMP